MARYLTEAINRSSKTQLQIAQECGYPNPNIVTMIKQGRTKMPINKVKVMADALDLDSKLLLKLCFEEYQPGNWEAIEEIFRR